MASIGGLSNNTSSGVTGVKGYGGLASGLDRDSLIEQMTAGTRSKIAKQGQKKQTFGWQQEAYRSVSSKLVEMSNKFMSFTSPTTNLLNTDFFGRSKVTSVGANSKYLEVTGMGGNASDSLTILGIKQMASNARATTVGSSSDQVLRSGGIKSDLETEAISNIQGKYITVQYGDKKFNVRFNSEDYGQSILEGDPSKTSEAMDAAVAEMNKNLKNTIVATGKTLADVMEFAVQDGKIAMKEKVGADGAGGAEGNKLALVGGDDKLLQDLGYLAPDEKMSDIEKPDEKFAISKTGLKPENAVTLVTNMTFAERVAGKFLTFKYNGKNIDVTIDKDATTIEAVRQSLQDQLDKEIGRGRVEVTLSAADTHGKRGFEFKTKANGAEDKSSVLSVVSGDAGLMGEKGAFHMNYGESNRVNTTVAIGKSGLTGVSSDFTLMINGVAIDGITAESSVKEIIEKINSTKEAGVEVAYLENSDKFSIVSTDEGSSGRISLSGGLATAMFGSPTVVDGKDAIVTVQYQNGEQQELVRGSNSFQQDGLNITLKGTFGFDDKGALISGQGVTFDSKPDTEKALSAVNEFIKVYNELVESVSKQVTQKPNRSYAPLTDEQKAELSEDEIKRWEEKAKEGILFNDSILKGLSDDLRYIVSGMNISDLEAIGITKSSYYGDNGKLSINEDKFKAALESDPNKVAGLFSGKGTDGSEKGFITKMKETVDKYASTTGATKGILIEKAGSVLAPASITKNTIYEQIKEVDKYIERLKATLAKEQDRYVKQFTSLETVISQMNSQSSWLTQQ